MLFNSYLLLSVSLTMDDSGQETLDLNYSLNGRRFYPGKVSNKYIIKWMPTEGSMTNLLSWLNNQVLFLSCFIKSDFTSLGLTIHEY